MESTGSIASEESKTMNPKDLFSSEKLRELLKKIEPLYKNPQFLPKNDVEKVIKEVFYEVKRTMSQSIEWSKWANFFDKSLWTKLHHLTQSDDVDEYGCDRQFEMTIKPLFDFLYYKYWRVSIQGLEHIPSHGRAILVANHSGVLPFDGAMIKTGIMNEHPSSREVRFLVDDFVFHFPFLGTTMNRMGGIRACPENAERLLKNEELITVFPEGIKGISKPFKDRYRIQRFGRGGVIRLALETKSPIIPVAVIGAEEIYPLLYKSSVLARPLGLPFIPFTPLFPFAGALGAIPLPTKWSIQFGEPIRFDDHPPSAKTDRILINRENEKLRLKIQTMVDHALRDRNSVFSG